MSRVFADPKTDFVFQRIFGVEEHKALLIALLNALLDLDEAHRIVDVTLLPPEQRPRIRELKYSIVDVKCVDARGTRYVVEMQVLYVEAFDKRVVYNVAKAYVNQLAVGNPYPELNDVIGVSICNFELWPEGGKANVPMLSRWRMQEQGSGSLGLDQIQLVFLELPKLDVRREPRTLVEKWAYFFREAPNLEVVPAPLAAEPPFPDAFEAARLASFTMAEWDDYTAQLIAIQDEIGLESGALKRGLLQGREEGREEGRKEGREEGREEGRKEGREEGREEGRKAGREEGRGEGREEGRKEGLRAGVEAACDLLQIPLDEERRALLDGLDEEGLSALLQRIRAKRSWG